MSSFWIRTTAVAAFAAASVQAQAANVSVTLTGWAFGNGNRVDVNVTSYRGPAGGFMGSLSGTGLTDSNRFVTYCIELEQLFSFSTAPMVNYTVVDGATYFGSRRGDADKAERLGRLLTFVTQDTRRVDTAAESTSMQLAVWNIVYDTDWTVSTQSAFRDFSGYRGYANELLTGARGVTGSLFDVHALVGVGTQDFLLATWRPAVTRNSLTANAVPEPASLALVVAAIAGLGVARKRGVSRAGAAAA